MALGNVGSGIAKKILVSIDVMTKGARRKLKNFERQTKRSATNVSSSVTGNIGRAQSQLDRFGVKTRGVGNASAESAQQVRGMSDRIATFGKDAKFASDMASGFRMDMLSVMFAGMQLMSVFGGMITSMLKFTGVSDALGAAMKSVLLPITMVLQPLLIQLAEFLMNLSESEKMLAGLTTVGLAVAGVIMFIGGQVVMLAGALSMMSIAIGTVAGVIVGAIAIIAAGFMLGMKIGEVFSEEISAVMDFVAKNVRWMSDAVFQIIGGLLDFFEGFLMSLKGLFTADLDLLVDGWGKQIRAIYDIAVGILKGLTSFVGRWIADLASGIIKDAKKFGSNLVSGIAEGVRAAPEIIGNALRSLLPDWAVDILATAGSAAINPAVAVLDVLDVNDFVMTPGGQVLNTAPDDYIFGTRNPENLAGGGAPVTINIDAEVASDVDIRDLADEIERRIDRSTGGRSNIGNRGV